ncbi:kinase domain protein (macronuclear) [Tetrahymena thermophila SB210]|uniref:Kinase domain protein n=1 Tax=Tetrahymena thermophila (strain SB210) TaxID=312017 RepID=Q23FB4_TETTS|nr:kinase domain protein [Tetrahymena thermophila SB210]EAR95239.3 kinase domain protein [Tetrahymena thermophila SB210]|eukprot:XP_001015484.3 kinase domain protein [Tetrahymena thermophila SB210]
MEEEIAKKIFEQCLKNKVEYMSLDKCKEIVKHIFKEVGVCSIEYLDSGSFGVVLKYNNPNKLKKGAVKAIIGYLSDEASMKEIKDEIDLQINICNPYIAKVKEFTKIVLDKAYIIGFVWMHYYEDGSLKRFLDQLREQNQEIDFKTKMRLGIQLFDALSSMHQKNIFHRDIKAANILMHQGDCVIADFGISRIQNIEQQISNSQRFKGTPMFLDPEIHRGHLDKKMDLFAMGIVLLMMDNVVQFAYESHVAADMIDNYGYYSTSFAKNEIIQELRQKLNTNTIFFKIAEKLITNKVRQRPSAAQCLDLLKEEEKRLNLFTTQVYSTKKYGSSKVYENNEDDEFAIDKQSKVYENNDDDESDIDKYGDENAYIDSVREQSSKSFISNVPSFYSNKNDSEVLIKGKKHNQQINSNEKSNSNQNNINNIQKQYTTNNFFENKMGKTFNNQINNFMDGLVTDSIPYEANKKSQQVGGFSDHVDRLNDNSYDVNSERSLINKGDISQNNISSSDQSSSCYSSIGVQNIPAFQKFYIKQQQILFYQGLFEDFQTMIQAKKTDYNKFNGISFKFKALDNQTLQEHLIARKLEQLFIHIQSYFDYVKEPIYYFELDLKSIQNLNGDCIELIQNFLSTCYMKKVKFLYLKLKGEQERDGFQKIVKPLSDLYDIEKLDLQLYSFTKIRDKDFKLLTQACQQMDNLYSLKLNLQDNSALKDSSLEYLGKIFLKLEQLEEIQLIFWNNTRFSDYGLQSLLFGKKLLHFDLRIGNCSCVSDEGINSLCENLKSLEKLISLKLFSTNTTQFTDSALMSISNKLKKVQTLKVLNIQFNLAENISDEGLKSISELIEDPKKEFTQIVLNFNSSKCFTDRGINPLINSFSKQKKLTKLKLSFNECNQLEGAHLIAISNSLQSMEQLTSFQLDFNQSKITFGLDFLFRAFSSTKLLKKLKIFLNKSLLTTDFQKLLIESVSKLQLSQLALQFINNNRVQYQELKSCAAIKQIKNLNI